MTRLHTLDINAANLMVPPFSMTLKQSVAPDSLLRLASDGALPLKHLQVERMVCDGSELPRVHRRDRAEMEKNWGWYMKTKSMAVFRVDGGRFPDGLPAGAQLVAHTRYVEENQPTNDPANPRYQGTYSGLTWQLRLGRTESLNRNDPASLAFEPVADPVGIRLSAGPPDRLEAYLKPDGRCLAVHFDHAGNPSGGYTGELTFAMGPSSESIPATEGAAATTRIPVRDGMRPGRIEVRDTDGRIAVSNASPVALDGTPVWFGECHWHTEFSPDGQRPMHDALASARDELALDFAGPTDHMYHGTYGVRTAAEQAAICRAFDVPGRFCVLPGAELSRRYGHANVYAEDFETFLAMVERFERELSPAWEKQPHRYAFDPLVRLCPEGRSLIVPHHSNMDSYVRERVVRDDGRPFWNAMHFPIPADRKAVRLFEIVQNRGAFETETPDETWRIYDGGLGGSARTALTRGYRLGFVGGTDNHCGWPTRLAAGYGGLTGVISERLDSRSIFQALYRRRCYATSGARIVADATLNGRPMGSELTLEPGADRIFRIKIRGTAALTSVQIVHGGYPLADLAVGKDSDSVDLEWADERPGRPLEDAWYYVRARQADGHCVWLSPFWVDLPDS